MTTAGAVACRWCRSGDGEVVLDLGRQPSCDYFPQAGTPGPDPSYPLRLWACHRCGLAQLADDSPLAEPPLGQEPQALVQQAGEAVRLAASAGLLPRGDRVAEAGSPHGGSWRGLLAEQDLIDVSADPGSLADVVIDVFGLMHEADQRAALQRRVRRLSEDGLLLLQYHSLATIVARNQWNAVRHGHFAYYSTTGLVEMVRRHGLSPVTIMRFPLYGGTYLLAARRDAVPDRQVEQVLEDERAAGIGTPVRLHALGRGLHLSVEGLRQHLVAAAAAHRPVLGYAAASSAVPLLCAGDIGPDLLAAVADASPAKWGRALPGSRIPIVEPAELVRRRPVEVLLFVPDLLDEARAALPEIEASGGRWLVVDPAPRVIPPEPAAVRRPPALVGLAPAPVTVGLPVYNGEKHLAQALTGLLAQDFGDFELLVADNASTDATADIVRTAARTDPRVRYHRRDHNVGVTENHNRLAHDAVSPMFMWASSDDGYHPGRLDRCVQSLRERPDAVLAFTSATEIDGSGATTGSWSNGCRVDHPDPVVRLGDLLRLERDYSRYSYGLFSREALLATGLLPPVKNNDAILIAELALRGPFVDVREELLLHRRHDERLTAQTTSRDWYREQRSDGPRIVLPNVDEGLWYLRAILRAPLSRRQRLAALRALSPWLADNGVPMMKNVARALIDIVRMDVCTRQVRRPR